MRCFAICKYLCKLGKNRLLLCYFAKLAALNPARSTIFTSPCGVGNTKPSPAGWLFTYCSNPWICESNCWCKFCLYCSMAPNIALSPLYPGLAPGLPWASCANNNPLQSSPTRFWYCFPLLHHPARFLNHCRPIVCLLHLVYQTSDAPQYHLCCCQLIYPSYC